MAVSSRFSTELLVPKKWNDERSDHDDDQQQSPERSVIWSQQPKFNSIIDAKVPVVYYLSRNGQLDHPHFIRVSLSSSHGLFLRDVLNKLNFIRGNGMACMYSWSSKRSYKNGYVWQDLSEDDLIHPTNDHDYILKGSQLLQTSPTERSSLQQATANEVLDSSVHYSTKSSRKKNQSWTAFENSINSSSSKNNTSNEYRRVYKCESSRELGGAKLTDMATQSTEVANGPRSKSMREVYINKSVELSREDLSPPSMSSSDGLDGVSGSGNVDRCATALDPTVKSEFIGGRVKPARVFMQWISCGSTAAVKDCVSIKRKMRRTAI